MIKWISGFIILVVLIIVIGHFSQLRVFLGLIEQMKFSWLFFAVIFQSGTYMSLAAVWRLALRWFGEQISFFQLFLLSFSQLFVNQTIPTSGLSGVTIMTKFLLGRLITPKAIALAIALNVFSRQVAYLTSFIASIVVFWFYNELNKTLISLSLIFILIMVAVLILAALLWQQALKLKIPKLLNKYTSIRILINEIKKLDPKIVLNFKLFFPAVVFSVAIFIFDSLTLWTILKSLNLDLNFRLIFAAQVIASSIASLSFFPGGLGIFEGSLTGLLTFLGLSIEQAFTATILFRGFTYWLPMLPGFLLTQKE
ncbi:TPA: flippase-like domain-containing protein, partial [Legionella pneumophila]|nr:flippase-like domain-containing protein [Legionella pneumophila]